MPPTSCDGQLRTRRHLLGDFRCRLCGDWPFATRRGQLLILQRAHALRKTEEANEARGVALRIHVILAARDEPFVTFGEDGVYQQSDAAGFIRLFSLPTRVRALKDQEAANEAANVLPLVPRQDESADASGTPTEAELAIA